MRLATTYLAKTLIDERHREARELRTRRISREIRAEAKRLAKATARAVHSTTPERTAPAAARRADVVIDLRDEVVAQPRVKELARD